ncbi:hypothetical protein BD410DRAFT_835661 [Rickenella mellea]|uniref:Uncharacterized protein n=1 Tax=Rickenella mellea TaxID=50990 RepID=A0A4Y7QJG8_9AGAM|nr:hypothetical protein BD410DRAFT_835661 [Rickenella mellea]
MQSTFTLTRIVFFCIILFFNLLSFIFVLFNIGTARSASLPVSPGAAFVLFDSSLLFILLTLTYAGERQYVKWTSLVKFECIWTCMTTLLRFADSITVSAIGPATFCSASVSFPLCASSTLTVAASWLCAMSLGAYATTLVVAIKYHQQVRPHILGRSMSSVAWFAEGPPVPAKDAPRLVLSIPLDTLDIKSSDSESALTMPTIPEPCVLPPQEANHRPKWALDISARPGRDHPFLGRKLQSEPSVYSCDRESRVDPVHEASRETLVFANYMTVVREERTSAPSMPNWSVFLRSGSDIHTIPLPSP